MTRYERLNDWREYEINTKTIGIFVFSMAIQIPSILLINWIPWHSFELQPRTTSPEIGLGMGLYLVVVSILFVLVIKYMPTIPPWFKKLVKYSVFTLTFIGYIIIWSEMLRVERLAVLSLAMYVLVWYVLEEFNLDWIMFDVFALGLGLVVTVFIGYSFAPGVLIVFLIALIIWDKIAVDMTDWMDKLSAASTSLGIPNYVILPASLRVDFAETREWIKDTDQKRPEDLEIVMGLGDLVLPAMLTASVAFTLGLVQGSIIIVCMLAGLTVSIFDVDLELRRREDGLPGLPWLNTGIILGFLVGVILSDISIFTALGF